MPEPEAVIGAPGSGQSKQTGVPPPPDAGLRQGNAGAVWALFYRRYLKLTVVISSCWLCACSKSKPAVLLGHHE